MRHRIQGLRPPRQDPHNRAAINQRREVANSSPELVTDWGHTDGEMEIFPNVRDEFGPEGLWVGGFLGFGLFDELTDFVLDHVGIFKRIQVRHLANIQQIINILQNPLIENLVIHDKENSRFFLDSNVMHHVTEKFVPVLV